MYHIERKPKETIYQSKKHYTQFTQNETFLLNQLVYSFRNENIRISPHAQERICINKKLVYDTLSDCKVIEFNLTCKPDLNSCRILVRGNKVMDAIIDNKIESTNLCLVLDLCELRIVTSYLNIVNDNHESINWNRYTAEMDVIKIAQVMRNNK